MKNFFTVTLFLLTSLSLRAQMSVLFVDDNDFLVANSDTFLASLDASGYPVDYWNVQASGTVDINTMSSYDMVIWYTSTDGVGLELWSENDTSNFVIESYLDNYSGKLWIAGNDWLYDRYGSPQVVFGDQDFPRKYCGINSYDAQTYADDGGLGVSELNLNIASPFTSIDPILWIFPTNWYDDVITPIEGAVPVYDLGPEGYIFDGEATSLYYPNPVNNSKVLSFCFDPALISGKQNRDQLVTDVLDFFSTIESGVSMPVRYKHLTMFPNPANDVVNIRLDTWTKDGLINIRDAAGKVLLQKAFSGKELKLVTHSLSAGNYTVDIQTEEERITGQLMIVK